jgi:hypothetical protein
MPDVLGSNAILAPVVALVAWSLIMLIWLYVKRMPAMRGADSDAVTRAAHAGRGLSGVVPDQAEWPAHNYNHLMEQPTIFYAISISLALLGQGGGINLWVAWLYVVLRVAHSLIQATTNVLGVRFLMFALSSLCLFVLTFHAILVLAHTF